MSYDLQVGVMVGGMDNEYYTTISEPEYSNPTYNLREILAHCMDWNYEIGTAYKCDDALKKIDKGIEQLSCNPNEYRIYNPPNGWGDIDTALKALKSLRDCIYETSEERGIPVENLYMKWGE